MATSSAASDLGQHCLLYRILKGTKLIDFRHFYKGDNFCDFLFSLKETPSEKGPIVKGKNLLLRVNKLFLFKVDPFSERRQIILTVDIVLVYFNPCPAEY